MKRTIPTIWIVWILLSLPLLVVAIRHLRSATDQSVVEYQAAPDPERPDPDPYLLQEVDRHLDDLRNVSAFKKPEIPALFAAPRTGPVTDTRLMQGLIESAETTRTANKKIREFLMWAREKSAESPQNQLEFYESLANSPPTSEWEPLFELPGSLSLSRKATAKADRLGLELRVAEQYQRARRLYDQARVSNTQNLFLECLEVLGEIETFSEDLLTDEISNLRREARFWHHWGVIGSESSHTTPDNTKAIETALETIKQLFNPEGDDPYPPIAQTDEEKKHLRWLQDFQKELQIRVYLTALDDAETKEAFVKKANEFLSNYPEQHSETRKRFIRIVDNHLKSKTIVKVDAQEAYGVRNGNLFRGKFEKQGSNPNDTWYWFYRLDNNGKFAIKREQVYLKELKALPATPFPEASAFQYNTALKKLSEATSRETAWNQFHELLKTMKAELVQYRRDRGQQDVGVQFDKEEQFVDYVVRNWEDIEPIIGNDY